METAVDIFTGFLDSGKTSLIIDAVEHSDFDEYRQTVLILCEEGEEAFDPALLKKANIIPLVLEEEEQFNKDVLMGIWLQFSSGSCTD